MAAPYGDGLYTYEPPAGYGLNISDLFHIVEPKPEDPGINSKVDSIYPNVAIITHDAANQFGGMWAKEKLDLNMPFYTEMYLHLGRRYGASGNPADGMTFTLHNDLAGLNAIGGAGEGLGVYKGRKWIGPSQQTTEHGTYLKNSLVIEFDTYRNLRGRGAFVDDPGRDGDAHCALIIPRANAIFTADHRNVHYFTPSQDWIKFEATWTPDDDGGSGTLQYSFDGIERTHRVDDIQSTFGGNMVYWGFTGATGQQTSVQAAAITRLPKQGVVVEKAVKNAAGVDIDQGVAHPGDILSYTVKVTSQQVSRSIGPIIIEDGISEHVEYVSGNVRVTTKAGDEYEVGYTFRDQTMIVNTNHVFNEEGDWIEILFNIRVKEDAGGKIVYNKAEVIADGLTEPQETNETKVTIFAEPKKSVSEDSEAGKDGGAVKVGDAITYDVVYGNDEETPATVTITDELPSGVDFASATEGGRYEGATHTVTWTLPVVSPGTNGKVSVTVRVNERAAITIENDAKVQVGENEPRTTNTVENPVILEAPEKKVSDRSEAGREGSPVKRGDGVTYDVTYKNYLETDATVVITDRLPTGVDFVSATNDGAYNIDAHTVTWRLAGVPARSDGMVSVTVRVNQKAMVRIGNYALVRVGDHEPRYTNLVENPMRGSHCLKQTTNCRKTIKGRKIWMDHDKESGARPPGIEINLLRDGEVYKSVTLHATGDGVYLFTCLPIWKNSTHKYNYQVDEAMLPGGYTKVIEGYNVTNTYHRPVNR